MADGKTANEHLTLDLGIRGMTCASCVSRVEKALRKVPGVMDAGVNLASGRATVRYVGGTDTIAGMKAAVAATGYTAGEIAPDHHSHEGPQAFRRGRGGARPVGSRRCAPDSARLRSRNGFASRAGLSRLGHGDDRAQSQPADPVRVDHDGAVWPRLAIFPRRRSRLAAPRARDECTRGPRNERRLFLLSRRHLHAVMAAARNCQRLLRGCGGHRHPDPPGTLS